MAKITKAGGPTVDGLEVVPLEEGHVRTGAGAADPHAEPEYVEADAGEPEQSGSTAPEAEDDSDDRRAEYEAATVGELVAELKRRKLNSTGNKPELVDRLLADDAEWEDEEQ